MMQLSFVDNEAGKKGTITPFLTTDDFFTITPIITKELASGSGFTKCAETHKNTCLGLTITTESISDFSLSLSKDLLLRHPGQAMHFDYCH